MVFATPTFLFLYLPIALAGFFLAPRALRTPFLVAISLVFYAWGEKQIVFVLMASIALNWALALVVEKVQARRARGPLLAGAVLLNIGALLYFKYTNFFVENLNHALIWLHHAPVVVQPVHLPIGVSFVTFEALSYVIDVYRRDTRAARNPLHVAFYVSFFPHLIAGPILRFADIAPAVARPRVTRDELDRGVSRFIVGLTKKMLLSNPLGSVADAVFKLAPAQLAPTTAWLGVAAYALQIYFDFSGYSDMAIGLGRMFGFTLPENFRLPYAARSIQDFWRRWHISLSSWFRDYLFIPLGGSRAGAARTYRNLLLVFFLCGLWHGASWTFVAWGLFHGAFLVIERLRFGAWLGRAARPVQHGYTLAVVLVGWVFFRADTLAHAGHYLAAMAGATHARGPRVADYMSIRTWVAFAVALPAATLPLGDWIERRTPTDGLPEIVWRLGVTAAQLTLLVVAILFVAAETYNPFIYFRF
jgi:alginate O-acetyltransferase complex protein AlgI